MERKNVGTMPQATHLAMVVNASATMRGKEGKMAECINNALAEFSEQEHETRVTIVLASERNVMVENRTPIKGIRPLAFEAHDLRGCGMLLDALAATIIHMEETAPTVEKRIKVVVVTGGEEPACSEFTFEAVAELLDAKRSEGWEFNLLSV